MSNQLRALAGGVAAWYQLATNVTPRWLWLLLTAGLGAMLTVVLSIVDVVGDYMRVYLTLVGVIVASAASFLGGRLINEHADRRTIRRKALTALVYIEALLAILISLALTIDELQSVTPLSDAQKKRLVDRLCILAASSGTPPTFDDMLSNETDRHHAYMALAVFRFCRDMRPTEALTPATFDEWMRRAPLIMEEENRQLLEQRIGWLRDAKVHFENLAKGST